MTNPDGATPPCRRALSAIEKFAFFMRFLAPPTSLDNTPGGPRSIGRTAGALFSSSRLRPIATPPPCKTGNSTVAALSDKAVNLYSDLLLHDMGTGLADGVSQGQAGPQDFRTAPLWGLGQRIFFLHDGRTSDLLVAIQQHQSSGSEANAVCRRFNAIEHQPRSRTCSTSCARFSARWGSTNLERTLAVARDRSDKASPTTLRRDARSERAPAG